MLEQLDAPLQVPPVPPANIEELLRDLLRRADRIINVSAPFVRTASAYSEEPSWQYDDILAEIGAWERDAAGMLTGKSNNNTRNGAGR